MKLADTVPDTVLEERIEQQCVNKCCTLIYTVSECRDNWGFSYNSFDIAIV
jgi:hypothetical protein